MLRRLGNKTKLAAKIIEYFPKHNCYIELFFGAGGLFLNKPLVKYNILNDNDDDVFNLFMVLLDKKDELYDFILAAPYHQSLFKHWKTHKETDPVRKAGRFLVLSNFGLYGKPATLSLEMSSNKPILLKNIQLTYNLLVSKDKNISFLNKDFREVLTNVKYRNDSEKDKAFIYADPPYLKTTNNYTNGFTEQDSIDLFDVLCDSGIRFAMSEFDNPFIIKQAKQRGLHVNIIGERRTIKSRRTEILVTNYRTKLTLFSLHRNIKKKDE